LKSHYFSALRLYFSDLNLKIRVTITKINAPFPDPTLNKSREILLLFVFGSSSELLLAKKGIIQKNQNQTNLSSCCFPN
jgi:hypothetical protein